jgi:hypothetical protein
MLYNAYDQGRATQDLSYRFPDDATGDQDLHRNRTQIELHLAWYHLAGRVVGKAKADKIRYGTVTKSMRSFLTAINREPWKMTLLSLNHVKARVANSYDDCGM